MSMIIGTIIKCLWIVLCQVQILTGYGYPVEAKWLLHYLLGSGQDVEMPQEWWEEIIEKIWDGSESYPENFKILVESNWWADPAKEGVMHYTHPLTRVMGSFWVEVCDNTLYMEDVYDWHPGHDQPWESSALPLNGYWSFSGVPYLLGYFHALLGCAVYKDGSWFISEGIFALAEIAGAKPFTTYSVHRFE